MDLKSIDIEFTEATNAYKASKQRLGLCIASYEIQVIETFHRISTLPLSDCQQEFDKLEHIQGKLCIVMYKLDYNLNENLEFFVREFERIDHPRTRLHWHEKLTNGFDWANDSSSGS